jgi:hypothetical protein
LAICGTKEQIEAIIPDLNKLGYDFDKSSYVGNDWSLKNPYLLTDIGQQKGCLGYNEEPCCRHDTFHAHHQKDIILALAAAVDDCELYAGEWCKYIGSNSLDFTKDKLYKALGTGWRTMNLFTDNCNELNGHYPENKKYFVKATKEEILKHFTLELGKSLISRLPRIAFTSWPDMFSDECLKDMQERIRDKCKMPWLYSAHNLPYIAMDLETRPLKPATWNIKTDHPNIDFGYDMADGKDQTVITTNMAESIKIVGGTTCSSKKILGYKFKKGCEQYEAAAVKIGGIVNTDKLKDAGKYGIKVNNNSVVFDRLRDAGVLDLWFEPVYEEPKFKVGDWVMFTGPGGSLNGAEEVIGFHNASETFLKVGGREYAKCDVNNYRKATPEEIAKATSKVFTLRCTGGTFQIEVTGKGILYPGDRTYLDPERLKHIVYHFVGDYTVNQYTFKPIITHIDSGCKKNVPIEDWKKVIDAYEAINGVIALKVNECTSKSK